MLVTGPLLGPGRVLVTGLVHFEGLGGCLLLVHFEGLGGCLLLVDF